MADFKARLKKLRLEKRLSQEALGVELGFSRDQISNWETGRGQPDINDLPKIAQFLEVSIDYLTGKVNDRTQTLFPNALNTPTPQRIIELHRSMDLPAGAREVALEFEGLSKEEQLRRIEEAVKLAGKINSLPSEPRKAIETLIDFVVAAAQK